MKVLLNKQIGETVWLMHNDKVAFGTIKNILYRQFISNLDHETIVTVEKYTVVIEDNKYVGKFIEVSRDKDELFQDKESLIKSL